MNVCLTTVTYRRDLKVGRKRVIDEQWLSQPGVEQWPIFGTGVDIDNYVIDELHLLMRITDRLEEGLIGELQSLDEVRKNILII